jgi:carbonic anhydrase
VAIDSKLKYRTAAPMPSALSSPHGNWPATLLRDLIAGSVVFLVALPLCLGIALASGAPLISGLLAGIIGGILVGLLSGSQTSVTGPAAGLTAIVASQIAELGSFEAFLVALVIGGGLQVALGLAKAGFIAAFFPSSVIKGLLAAIGLILIIKQLPYVLGHVREVDSSLGDPTTAADSALRANPHEHPLVALGDLLSGTYHGGAMIIGLVSIAILVVWDQTPQLKRSLLPAPLVVVVFGILAVLFFGDRSEAWRLPLDLLVQVPVAENIGQFLAFLRFPDWSSLWLPAVYVSGVTIALVASLETLLNLEAVDNIDPRQRVSPPNQELIAQGAGNLLAGLVGGLPVTSVIVRSSVNLNAGSQTKLSAIFHGLLLLGFVVYLPVYLNLIPLSCLAAILMVTGFKLASPSLLFQLYRQGRFVFLPFAITVVAIVLTDLLIGILIGLGMSLMFILASNYRRPIHRIIEQHLGGQVQHIELANQVSFLNRAALEKALRETPPGAHILLDARHSDYIDPDVLSLIQEFRHKTAPALGIQLSLRGFKDHYQLQDDIRYVDYTTRELQDRLTPSQVLRLLVDGNQRFRSGQPLPRDLRRQVGATAQGQYPMAVILSCMDARTPVELLFDMGLGDLLNIRLAGNAMLGPRTLASIEFGCTVAGAKLVVALGHTGSTVLRAAVAAACQAPDATPEAFGEHFPHIVEQLRGAIAPDIIATFASLSDREQQQQVDLVARSHALRSVEQIVQQSATVRSLLERGQIGLVAAMYDTHRGQIDFLPESMLGLNLPTQNLSPDPNPAG